MYVSKDLLGTMNNDASRNAGAFLIKSLELQQVIEQSNRDFKIFWGWLYGVIVRLMEEAVPDDIAAVSQQDTIYLAEFLNTFDEYCEVDNGEKLIHSLQKLAFFVRNNSLLYFKIQRIVRNANSILNVSVNICKTKTYKNYHE